MRGFFKPIIVIFWTREKGLAQTLSDPGCGCQRGGAQAKAPQQCVVSPPAWRERTSPSSAHQARTEQGCPCTQVQDLCLESLSTDRNCLWPVGKLGSFRSCNSGGVGLCLHTDPCPVGWQLWSRLMPGSAAQGRDQTRDKMSQFFSYPAAQFLLQVSCLTT